MPSHWGYYELVADDVDSLKELPSQFLEVEGAPAECRVVDVTYERKGWNGQELTVRYWVDPKRLLVVKEEFSQLQGNGKLWHWVYTVDSVKLNQPPPEWLIKAS